jgi:hypothetical protein
MLVKTIDVKELFVEHLKKRGFVSKAWVLTYVDDENNLCRLLRETMRGKQDQNNKLLQKIRKLI